MSFPTAGNDHTGTDAAMTITITAAARIAALLEQAPPLTAAQRDRVATLFNTRTGLAAPPARKAA